VHELVHERVGSGSELEEERGDAGFGEGMVNPLIVFCLYAVDRDRRSTRFPTLEFFDTKKAAPTGGQPQMRDFAQTSEFVNGASREWRREVSASR